MDHSNRIDASNGNCFWKNAIDKEMTNVAVKFEILDEDKLALVVFTKASGYLVFDVNMDFTLKARSVHNGHRTVELEHYTFTGVVSR